jgi:hypothetical protein
MSAEKGPPPELAALFNRQDILSAGWPEEMPFLPDTRRDTLGADGPEAKLASLDRQIASTGMVPVGIHKKLIAIHCEGLRELAKQIGANVTATTFSGMLSQIGAFLRERL